MCPQACAFCTSPLALVNGYTIQWICNTYPPRLVGGTFVWFSRPPYHTNVCNPLRADALKIDIVTPAKLCGNVYNVSADKRRVALYSIKSMIHCIRRAGYPACEWSSDPIVVVLSVDAPQDEVRQIT